MQGEMVGLVEFKGEVELGGLREKMARGVRGRMNIDWGDYLKHHWNELAGSIASIKATQLLLWHNNHPQILRELAPVAFPVLSKLVARGNRISTLEGLSASNWPNLKELDLSDNLIVSTRSLSKINLRSLTLLDLNVNPIASLEELFKCNFQSIEKMLVNNRKFQMETDPITWKIKLPKAVQNDFIPPSQHARRNRRNFLQHLQQPSGLTYCKIQQMYSHRRA